MQPITNDDEDILEPELEGDPANDNDDDGYDHIDLESDPDDVANDNGDEPKAPPRKKTPVERDPRNYGYVNAVPGRLEQLLDRAGFNPALIAPAQRRTAFEIALAWQKRMFDEDDLVKALRFTRGSVRRAIDALRRAARAGTVVG